jgi:hypothetical protein
MHRHGFLWFSQPKNQKKIVPRSKRKNSVNQQKNQIVGYFMNLKVYIKRFYFIRRKSMNVPSSGIHCKAAKTSFYSRYNKWQYIYGKKNHLLGS